jgi:AraC-like DNA-binding protein
MSENEAYHIWAEWLNERQLGLLYMLKQSGQSERNVMDQTEKLRTWAEQQLPFTITAGVGMFASNFGGVTESYRAAAQLLRYKASLGRNRVLVPADLASRPRGEAFRLLPLFRDLCTAYRTNDEAWNERFEELCGQLRGRLYTVDETFSLFQHLIDHLHKAMAELPKDLQSLWEEEQAEMFRIAARQETAEELFGSVREVLSRTFDRMRELRESKTNHQLIRNVKQFIGEHYGNPDLSLAHLSQEFGLGGSYMSRLFKEEFGVKFIDYITQVRVEQAIAMLSDKEMTVQEIAEAVGYIRPMTFIRVFKKVTGSTPGSYRKLRE